jgi:hypothetical protein
VKNEPGLLEFEIRQPRNTHKLGINWEQSGNNLEKAEKAEKS